MNQYNKNAEIVKKDLVLEILQKFYMDGLNIDFFNFAEVQVAGRPTYPHYGNRHSGLSETDFLEIYDCVKTEDGASENYTLCLRNKHVDVAVHYTYCKTTKVNKICTTVTNRTDHELALDYVSSYVDVGFWRYGFADSSAYISSHGWYTEAQWSKFPLISLGVFSGNRSHSMKRYVLGNTGTWPTKSHLPIMILENTAKNEVVLYNAESNGCWNIELGDIEERLTVNVDGGNREDNGWTKTLAPNESYRTITTVMIRANSVEEVLKRLTDYRREKQSRQHDIHSKLICNPYQWFCEPFPTQNNLMQYADALLENEIHPDYFVIDCGWHDEDGDPFYCLGRWEESKSRFPDGLNRLLDRIKERDVKVGLWIEPEVVGGVGDAKDLYSDDCYFQRDGMSVVISNRYHLDFRNRKVVDRLNSVVDRLMRDYALGYVKIDYNTEARSGTEFGGNNSVASMQEHSARVAAWLEELGARYPDLIIETCASGGNRMDNLTVAASDLISTSDQTMVKKYAYIVGNIFTALLPEQAGVWCYPAGKNGEPITEETVIMNMVNASLCVMQIASKIDELTPLQIALVREGVDFYRSIAEFKKTAYPYYPNGFNVWDGDSVVFGLKNGERCLLAVYCMKDCDAVADLSGLGGNVRAEVAYPKTVETEYSLQDGILTLKSGKEPIARVFEIFVK